MNLSAMFDLYAQLAPAELFRLLQRQMGVIVIAKHGNTCPNCW